MRTEEYKQVRSHWVPEGARLGRRGGWGVGSAMSPPLPPSALTAILTIHRDPPPLLFQHYCCSYPRPPTLKLLLTLRLEGRTCQS